MRLQDFLIGLGVFGLFATIILSMVNPFDDDGVYGKNNLNVTYDTKTQEAYTGLSGISNDTTNDYDIARKELEKNAPGGNNSNPGGTLDSISASSIKAVVSIPRSFLTVTHILGGLSTYLGFPTAIMSWVLTAIIIIIVILLLSSVLQNRL